MTTLPNTQSPLDQLDRELHDLTREHGHVIDLDQFRRNLDITDQRTAPRAPDPADTPSQLRSESQLRHELNLAFTDLGAAAFALAHHGTTTDARLTPPRAAHPPPLRPPRRDHTRRLTPAASTKLSVAIAGRAGPSAALKISSAKDESEASLADRGRSPPGLLPFQS